MASSALRSLLPFAFFPQKAGISHPVKGWCINENYGAPLTPFVLGALPWLLRHRRGYATTEDEGKSPETRRK